jgi:signal peptidase I
LDLFYVSEGFISSLELADTKVQDSKGADIVQCYSSTTLLNIAEKLLPDVVVVDFDLLEEDYIAFFKSLRILSPEASIMVLIERDDYNNLLISIEQGGIDEYLVKPVNKDDFMTRFHMVSRRNKIITEEPGTEQAGPVVEDKPEVEDIFGFPVDSTETSESTHEISDEDFIPADPEIELDLNIFDDATVAPEAENRFTAIFDDEQSGKNEEATGITDELLVIPDLPHDEVFDHNFEAREIDLENLFDDREEEVFAIEPPPDENTNKMQETELFNETPPLEDDLYQYQQNLKYGASQLHKGRRAGRKKATGSRVVSSFSLIGNILLICVLIMMALISIILILDRISENVPQVGGYQVYVIKSDYLSPEVASGSLAIGRKADLGQINEGDIITYRSADDSAAIAAGRVAGIKRENGLRVIDVSGADASGERQSVEPEAVIGRLICAVPYIGYLIDYAQTREGLILLIFVPGILIIVFQTSKIIKYFYRR